MERLGLQGLVNLDTYPVRDSCDNIQPDLEVIMMHVLYNGCKHFDFKMKQLTLIHDT